LVGYFGDGEGARVMGGGQQRQRDFVRGLDEVASDLPKAGAVFNLEDADACGGRAHRLKRVAQFLGGRFPHEGGQGGECGHGRPRMRFAPALGLWAQGVKQNLRFVPRL